MLRIDLNIVWEIINVLILFALVKKFLFKPVREILKKRNDEIEASYQAAEKTNKDADDLKAQLAASASKIAENEEKAVADAKVKGAAEYDRIVSEAQPKSEQIISEARDKAKAVADQEKRKAEDEITGMVKEAAAKIAESESDEKLYDDFLKEVSQNEQ